MVVFNLEQIKIIYEDAINKYPDECCGILLEKRDDRNRRVVEMIYQANNAAEEKLRKNHFRIMIDVVLYAEFIAIWNNCEIVGFYHSHTDCGAEASEEDCRFAIPGMSYPIVSVEGGQIGKLLSWERAWRKGYEDFRKEMIETADACRDSSGTALE